MRVCFEQKHFFIADSIFQVFSSKSLNAFVERDEAKFERSFFPSFFFSSAMEKSSISFLMLFSTINSDACKVNNLLGLFCFSCFVHFAVHCFVYYLRLFFLFAVFTIGIYALFCLRATYFF